MKKNELVKILSYLSASYQSLFKYPSGDEDVDKMTEEVWFDSLNRYQKEEVMSAIKTIKYEGCQYPPNDGMIVKRIEDLKNTERITGDEAWERALMLAKYASSQVIRRYTSEGDKMRQREDIAFKGESELLIRAIKSCGGLNGIGDNPNDTYVKRSFIQTFETLQESEEANERNQIAGVPETLKIESGDIDDEIKKLGEGFKR